MNSIHHRPAWGIALAAVALAFTSACGSEIATAPADLGNVVNEQSSPAQPRQKCFGSADFAERCGQVDVDDGQGGSARPGRLPNAWDN
jgi:hypothetical protein